MKLIKINTDHYVIVDDSEIKEGDWYYWEVTKTIQIAKLDSLNRLPKSSDGSKKITHSTKPLEEGTTIHDIEHKRWILIKYIDLQEVKELIGEVDVEQYVWDNPVLSRKEVYELFNEVFKDKHIEGAYRISASKQVYQFNTKLRELAKQKALEDNKDKKYTEEDLKRYHNIMCLHGNKKGEEFIQSLQPKTEWEVEFDENGKLILV